MPLATSPRISLCSAVKGSAYVVSNGPQGNAFGLHWFAPASAPRATLVFLPGFAQNPMAFLADPRLHSTLRAANLASVFVRFRGRRGLRDPCGDWNIAALAKTELQAALDRAHGFGAPVFVVGHSTGGLVIAAATALGRLSRVAGAVLLATPRSPVMQAPRAGRAMRRFARWQATRGGFFPGAEIGRALARGQPVWRGFRPVQLWAPGALSQTMADAVLRGSFDRDAWGVLADLAALSASGGEVLPGVPGLRADLGVPTLVLAGAADTLAPPVTVTPWTRAASCANPHAWVLGPRAGSPAVGHVDMLVGDTAHTHVWPRVLAFVDAQA